MATAELDFPMAKKKDTSIRVDQETAELIRKASTLKDMSIMDYLRQIVTPIARRDLMAEAKKLTDSPPPKRKP